MARRGDGIYLRGKSWWLDFTHEGKRHYVRLGKGISRTVAGEIATVSAFDPGSCRGMAQAGSRKGKTAKALKVKVGDRSCWISK